jgi:hypothetical protein
VNALSIVMAKLAGIRKAVLALMNENVSRNRSSGEVLTRTNYPPDLAQHHFTQAARLLEDLKQALPDLYGDFQAIKVEPEAAMAIPNPSKEVPPLLASAG